MALFVHVFFLVCTMVASGASLVACTWLLVKLSSGTQAVPDAAALVGLRG